MDKIVLPSLTRLRTGALQGLLRNGRQPLKRFGMIESPKELIGSLRKILGKLKTVRIPDNGSWRPQARGVPAIQGWMILLGNIVAGRINQMHTASIVHRHPVQGLPLEGDGHHVARPDLGL
jgi:hypothetical protein